MTDGESIVRKTLLGREFATANKLRLLPTFYDFLPPQTASRRSPDRYTTIFLPFFQYCLKIYISQNSGVGVANSGLPPPRELTWLVLPLARRTSDRPRISAWSDKSDTRGWSPRTDVGATLTRETTASGNTIRKPTSVVFPARPKAGG